MNKTYKVVMLPTEKTSALVLNLDNELEYDEVLRSYLGVTQQILCIISDEKIKGGDWCVLQVAGVLLIDKSIGKNTFETIGVTHPNCEPKKIVATTDRSILKEHNKDGDGGFILFPSLPESFIQTYIKAFNEGKPITEVDLEMEEYAVGSYGLSDGEPTIDIRIKTRPDNTVIIHKNKMYSRDEVVDILNKYWEYCHIEEGSMSLNEWINTNLK